MSEENASIPNVSSQPLELPKSEPVKYEVDIGFDGQCLRLVVPIAIGKMGVYGAIQMLMEQASAIFNDIERRRREANLVKPSMMSKILRSH